MNVAKVPASSNDWRVMDIFLFSNGQLNSPPRKYHLRFEELNWWDATLNYLARSQYGSINSRIDLYTTDGHKLEGPLQLKNGAAYVAVERSNLFIDTGYDKYLVKATRSLEKRQAKKPNSNETLFAAENTNEPATQLTMDTANNEVQKDNAVVESTAVDSSDEQEKILELQALLDTRRQSQRSNSSATKQNDKKKPSLVSRPAAFRKMNTLNPIDTDICLNKDSKSLEKRSTKRPSNESEPTAENTTETAAEIIIDATNNEQKSNDEVVESSAVNSSKNQNKPLEPQALHDTQMLSLKRNSTTTKENDKRKPSLASRLAVFRKIGTLNPIADTDIHPDKATKSLEKRPVKRSSNETVLTAENSTETAAKINTDFTNNEFQKYNALVESSVVNSSKDQNKPLEPQVLHNTQRLSQNGNSIAPKETDKRKSSLSSRPAVFRKISTLNPPDTLPGSKRTSLKRSNSPPKRNHKLNGKTNERPPLDGNLGSKTVPKSTSKTEHNKILEAILQPIVEPIKMDKVAEKPKDTSQVINTIIIPNQKSQITDYNHVDNLINDKDMIVVSDLYKNPISEMTSVVVDSDSNTFLIESKRDTITQELIKINEESETSQIQPIYRESTSELSDNVTQKHKTVPKNSSKIKFTTTPSIQAYSVSDKLDDSYLAIINRGDILNFQLKIEVRSADDSTITSQKTPKSETNLIKLDKSSQVRIDNDLMIQGNILYSTLSEQAQLINSDGNSKIVVVQCGCCEHYCNNVEKRDVTELKDKNRYVMLLPTIRCRGHHERSRCADDLSNERDIKKTPRKDRSSIIHPVKKTYSDMSLERIVGIPKGAESLISAQDMNETAVNSTNLNTNEDLSRNVSIVTSRHVAIGEQQANSEYPSRKINQSPSETVTETKKTESAVIQTVLINFVDKSTQTEWCNLLLEARCHDDGRYSFHLPPLNVIRYYTI